VNPGLTAMANALRVGDHLLERLGARSAGRSATNGKFERSDTTVQPHTTEVQESTR